MALISHARKFIYVLNPRTASTATAMALRKATDATFVPEESLMDEDGKILVQKKHSNIPQLLKHGIVSEEIATGYFKFVTVRNPFDSIVSLWAKKTKDYAALLEDRNSWVHKVPGYAESMERAAGKGFSEWAIEEFSGNLESGKPGTINSNYIREVDHMLRFENLAEDFAAITGRLGLDEDFVIPEANRTESRGGRDYRSFYDAASRKLIETVFAEEIDRLGYAF